MLLPCFAFISCQLLAQEMSLPFQNKVYKSQDSPDGWQTKHTIDAVVGGLSFLPLSEIIQDKINNK